MRVFGACGNRLLCFAHVCFCNRLRYRLRPLYIYAGSVPGLAQAILFRPSPGLAGTHRTVRVSAALRRCRTFWKNARENSPGGQDHETTQPTACGIRSGHEENGSGWDSGEGFLGRFGRIAAISEVERSRMLILFRKCSKIRKLSNNEDR